MDVPIATYGVFGKGKTTATDRLCQLAGTEGAAAGRDAEEAVSDARADYAEAVDRRLQELVAQGWFLPEYVEMVRTDAAAVPVP